MGSYMKRFEHLEIPLEKIISATNNFNEENVIGHGGFGKVYKGELSHSHSNGKSMVALKRLNRRGDQGDAEFYKEVTMLSCYRHENIISLLGFSSGRKEMILVYEYASRGSLDKHLKDKNLTWTQRLKICLDAVKGLCYLHDPRETYQRLIHCDIKSANILLDDNFNAKVADFGLSKIGPANQQNSILVTDTLGTLGYCDPVYMKTYTLTKESDVYSFGVVLFEVLCGKQCTEVSNGEFKILVPMWKKSYKENNLDEIILQDIRQQINPRSLEIFTSIAYQCLEISRKERPAMSLVVEKLEIALQMQILPEEYVEIANAAVDPLLYRSLEEFKELLSKGVLLNGGTSWLSLNDKEEHHVMVSIHEYLSLDDPNRDYSRRYWSKEKSRFAVGCYKTRLMEFKLHVRIPIFLSPGIAYGLYLVFQHGIRVGMKQQHVGVRYKLQGEKRISIVHFTDKENKWLVAELYQFTSNKESILDLEISLEDCSLSGDFYIEGIEFRPLEKETPVARQVVIANEEIVVPPLLDRFTEDSEELLSQGFLLNGGKTWLSINSEREFCVVLSIEDCLIRDEGNRKDSDRFSLEKDSRFAVGCYRAYSMDFKIRVRTPFILSPHVTYGINLIFQCINIEYMELPSFSIWYKLDGETRVSIVHLADQREDGLLVAELYKFTCDSDKSIPDLKIIFEKCWFSGYFHVEGIEFHPLRRVEHALVAVGYEDIHKVAVTPLFYTSTDELKLLLTRGILLNGCKKVIRFAVGVIGNLVVNSCR
ncbi:kinase-like domain, phloem protein 2-like protein [Tanacetum coccineum]